MKTSEARPPFASPTLNCAIRPGRLLAIAALLWAALLSPSAQAQIYSADNGLGTGGGVVVFAAGSGGNVLPDMTLVGASTTINNIRGVVADSGSLFVLCDDGINRPFVLKYSLPTAGNAAPVSKTFLAPKTGAAFGTYTYATALAVDGTNLYALDAGTGGGSSGAVNVYPLANLTTNSNASPLAATRTIDGANNATTLLNRPNGIAVDASFIYLANNSGNNLLAFALGADGNVAPSKTITGLSSPVGVAVDATTIYVLNSGNSTVTTYPVGTAGGAVAAATTIGSGVFDLNIFYVSVDSSNIYVGNSPSVFVFPKTANGANVTPATTIAGANAIGGINSFFVLSAPGTAAPTVTAGGGSTAYTAGGGAVTVDSAVALTAVPSTLATATVQITTGLQSAQDVLAFTNANATTFGNIAGIYNVTLATLRLVSEGATATVAQWQAALRAVTYNNTSGSPTAGNRTVTTKVFDGAQTSATATKTVTVALAPTVASATVPANGTYKIGQNLDFTVTYSTIVNVVTSGGTPLIAVTLDTGGTVNAAYVSGTGSTTLTFRYTVAAGNFDATGIAVASTITLNGGTIRDGALNNAPATGLGFAGTTGVLADGVAPAVSSVARVGTTPTNAASVGYTVTFSENVTGVDATDFTLTTTGTAVGTVASVTGSNATYTVTVNTVSGVGALRLDLNGSGTGIADTSTNAISGGFTGGQTYTIDTAPPTVASVGVPSNGTYTVGQALSFTVNF